MLRAILFQQPIRGATRSLARHQSTIAHVARPSPVIQSRRLLLPTLYHPPVRCYSAPTGLTKGEVEGRIMDLLRKFDKVKDPEKITSTSHFANDLGLDSLDTVEVVMAIEEEFSIEIPDKDADAIHSLDKAVEYILSQPDGLGG